MGKLFEEIQRRKVFRVAAVYAVVAWLIIQVTGEVLPTFSAPEWVSQTIIFLLILGMPITLVMAWAFDLTPEGIKATTSGEAADTVPQGTGQRLTNVMLGLVLLAVGFLIVDQYMFESQLNVDNVTNSDQNSVSNLSRRFFIPLGVIAQRTLPSNVDIALSPDGKRLAFSARRPNKPLQLYIQELDQLESRVLQGTENASSPFFSPDGQWIGFLQDGLKKISIRGGPPQELADSMRPSTGGYWSRDDTLFYSSDSQEGRRLMRIAATGGATEQVEINSDTFAAQYWPNLLPNDDALLFSAQPPTGANDGQITLLTISSGEARILIQDGYNARYVPSGHIVFMRSATLWAVPFDLDRLVTTGPEVPVIAGVHTESLRGASAYTFSDNGLLIYLPGEDMQRLEAARNTLMWIDRDGIEEPLPPTGNSLSWVVSPDGQRLAGVIRGNGNSDIWTYDLSRNTLSRLTFYEGADSRPLWSPDGTRIAFSSNRNGGGIWWRAANGTGEAELLLTGSGNTPVPRSFTRDGTKLVYSQNRDLHLLTLDSESPSEPLIQTEFIEQFAQISPNGRWIAYDSNETGQVEIYVRPFPDIDAGKWQVSNEGGTFPKWNPNGRELMFLRITAGSGRDVWTAQVETENEFQHATPQLLVPNLDGERTFADTLDTSPDGERILLSRRSVSSDAPAAERTHLVVVENWFEELKRLAPPDPQ